MTPRGERLHRHSGGWTLRETPMMCLGVDFLFYFILFNPAWDSSGFLSLRTWCLHHFCKISTVMLNVAPLLPLRLFLL